MQRLFVILLFLVPLQSFSQFKLDEKDIYLGASSLIVAGGGNIFEYMFEEAPSNSEVKLANRRMVNMFDREATYHYSKTSRTLSDISITALVFSPLLLLADEGVQSDFLTLGSMYAEGLGLIEGINSIVKAGISRPRPYVYNSEVPEEVKYNKDAKKSFFSSHTAFAFYSATFLTQVGDEYIESKSARTVMWIGAYTVAAAVGYFRFDAGMHFPTDILVGAAAGALAGYYIPYIHRENKSDDEPLLLIAPPSDRILIKFTYPF